MRFGKILFVLVLVVCIFETIRLWTVSPEQMAAHFNVEGIPDRFTSRSQFFGFQVQVLLIVTGLGLILQVLTRIIPLEWVNLPNRAYWLAVEHRNTALDRLGSFAALLFALILLVVLLGFELAVSANLHQPIIFNARMMTPLIMGFIAVSLVMLVGLVRSFQISRDGEAKR